ncbi:hypothetical protein [Wukongibacter sp. M2B1]|uniref:hypothetical protein n=1 Tax=Wukongibacter sp. M2B1 TaxID=3088895 RepID=UPI003D7946B4
MREMDYELRDSISALIVAIIREDVATVEDAFEVLEGKTPITRNRGSVDEMIALRNEGLRYREIGEIFGLKESSVFYRIKREKARRKKVV